MRSPRADLRPSALLGALFALLVGGCADEVPEPEGATTAAPAPLERITMPAEDGNVHQVRLVQRGDRYAFEPSEIVLPPGDVVRFVMTGAQPESVAFDTAGATAEAAAFIHQRRLDMGVLLTDAGQAYDVPFTEAPAGRYPFVSIPHGAQGMRGSVVVQPRD